MKIGPLVHRLRKHVGLSQAALGKQLGVTHTTIGLWERDEGGIDEWHRIQLLAYARRVAKDARIIAALESIQPVTGP